MDRLHQKLQETINLSVRQGDEMICVERSSSNRSMMQVVQIVGARAPLHITAVGKVYLAEEGSRGWADYAKRIGLPAFTENTLRTLTSLARELERVKRQGYAFDNEEPRKGFPVLAPGFTTRKASSLPACRYQRRRTGSIRHGRRRSNKPRIRFPSLSVFGLPAAPRMCAARPANQWRLRRTRCASFALRSFVASAIPRIREPATNEAR